MRAGRGMGMRDPKRMMERIKSMDKNGDGKIESSEVPEMMQRMFKRLDANGDGVADKKEIDAMKERMRGRSGRDDRESRRDDAPSLGTEAPAFKLKRMESEEFVELASFKGKKPVVLVFGSYT